MRELNQLENHLRSWRPRRPSASIKQRLFSKAAPAESELPDPIAWKWLAPAMALCFGAVMLLARSPHSSLGEPTGYRRMPTFALSNLDFATYYAAAGQNDRNTLPLKTFEWTNGAHSSTTPASFFDRTGYRE